MKFILQVQRAGTQGFRDLQPFSYDNAGRFNTRKIALSHAIKARMRWAGNYAQFRDAQFRIVEV